MGVTNTLENLEVASCEKVNFERHAANRYRIQIIVNGSLLLSTLGSFQEAISRLEKCLLFARQHHDFSVQEVASVLAYNYIQAGSFKQAHTLLVEQEMNLCQFRSVERIRQVWKMLAVSSDALGLTSESRRWLRLVNSN